MKLSTSFACLLLPALAAWAFALSSAAFLPVDDGQDVRLARRDVPTFSRQSGSLRLKSMLLAADASLLVHPARRSTPLSLFADARNTPPQIFYCEPIRFDWAISDGPNEVRRLTNNATITVWSMEDRLSEKVRVVRRRRLSEWEAYRAIYSLAKVFRYTAETNYQGSSWTWTPDVPAGHMMSVPERSTIASLPPTGPVNSLLPPLLTDLSMPKTPTSGRGPMPSQLRCSCSLACSSRTRPGRASLSPLLRET